LLAAAFINMSHISGLSDETALLLQVQTRSLNLPGLILGGMIIGALGVLDDVTVTQASAVWELRHANPELGRSDLYRRGLRVGRDHIASTVNTLVVAYAGASLTLFLLFELSGQSVTTILNSEGMAIALIAMLVGSIGLVASVPLTTWLAALAAGATAIPHPAPGAPGPGTPHESPSQPETAPSAPDDEDARWRAYFGHFGDSGAPDQRD
jgi:uncharacterized membrane protein